MPMMWGIGYDWAIFVALLAWVVMLGVVIWALVRTVLWNQARRNDEWVHLSANEREALETLRRRYARGDIGTDTFEQARQYLDAPARADDDLIPSGR